MTDVAKWLEQLGLDRYSSVFADNDIDAEVLPELSDADLEKLGVTLGHRKKLLKAIACVQAGGSVPEPPASATALQSSSNSTESTDAERRQLTVMFCDLVGSTELSQRLDPEDLGDVVSACQDTWKAGVERYAGYVARYMGDGVLVYFGFPQAHEEDAERAVRAALDIVNATANLSERMWREKGVELAVRVGIATGPVVVGDLVGEGASQESAVVGETPNLAARLQGIAEPNAVVISTGTRRLSANRFEYHDLGEHELKGLSGVVHAWQVVGESGAESRFDATHDERLSPLVGRDNEIDLMSGRWLRAKSGEGQVVLLSGEPGIGKSRLIQLLGERVAEEPHERLLYQCSPYHVNSALYPVINQLVQAAGFVPADTPQTKLEKLETLLRTSSDIPMTDVSLIGDLLSVPVGDGHASLDPDPRRRKEETLAALVRQLEGLAARAPVLCIFEDIHWIDPSTMDLFERLVERVQTLRVLMGTTFRPEFVPPWIGRAHVISLVLGRVNRPDILSIVASVSGGKELPDEVLDQIVTKTDGIPLFVEELTKAVLESEFILDEGDRYTLAGSLESLAVPTTLQDSLMARLDRLGQVKELAQIGAALGREFSFEVLAAVAPLERGELTMALDELVGSGLVYRRGTPPQATYTFKHALVKDAAYASLLKRSRKQLHGRIGQVLESGFPDVAENQPEMLAHHYTEAGFSEAAIHHWRRAGERAVQRFADAEAIVHFSKGLDLITSLPETPERDALELSLRIGLGPAMMMSKGFGHLDLKSVYDRGTELSRKVGDVRQRFTVTWGSWLFNQFQVQLAEARMLSEEVLDVAGQQADTALHLQAHHSAWTTLLCRGEIMECREHAEQGFTLYNRDAHHLQTFQFGGHDPGVCARSHLAISNWFLGSVDRAVDFARDAIDLAKDLDHPNTLLITHSFQSWFYQYRREVDLVRRNAEAAIALCRETGLGPAVLAACTVLRGWAMAADGEIREGLEELRRGLEAFRHSGTKHRESYFLALLGQAYGWTGEYDKGLTALEEARTFVDQFGERTWEAEIHRLRGELLLAQSSRQLGEAERCYDRALEIARHQGARSLELRAAMSLTRLRFDRGERARAHELLAPLYDRFSEGFDTGDLREAKDLLESLS